MNEAIKELEKLFSTTAKGNTVYFNDVTYTPIPGPVAEAVKDIMSEYPDVKYRLGLYSVTVIDTGDLKKKPLNNSLKKPVESNRTNVGKLHDDFVTGTIGEKELKDKLKDMGYGKQKVANIVDKWKPEIVKSSKLDDAMGDIAELEDEFALVDYVKKILKKNGMSDKFKDFCDETDEAETPEELGKVAEKYIRMAIKSSRRPIKSSVSDYFPVEGMDADKLEDIVKQYDNKSDIRTALEDYFHIYDDYAEMSVEEFEQALDGYFGEMGDGLYEPEETHEDESEFYTTAYESDDDYSADYYDGDDYSEGLE